MPAPGQGIVAIEIRRDDEGTARVLQRVHDPIAAAAMSAERTVVSPLGGGCQLPLGALGTIKGAAMDLQAIVCTPDGARVVRARASGSAADPVALGRLIAEQLAAGGAKEILDAGIISF